MGRKVSTSCTIFRTEDGDLSIDGTVSGILQPAEPDVGIMSSWVEDLVFIAEDGTEWELTEREQEFAEERLCHVTAGD